MKEPILSANELTHAARSLLMAVIGAPHEIECASVTVHFDEKKPGHNALNQMSRRLESELAALLEKLCGEPVAWRWRKTNAPWSLEFTLDIYPNKEIKEQEIRNLIEEGGLAIGLGTFRGVFGKFIIDAWE